MDRSVQQALLDVNSESVPVDVGANDHVEADEGSEEGGRAEECQQEQGQQEEDEVEVQPRVLFAVNAGNHQHREGTERNRTVCHKPADTYSFKLTFDETQTQSP